MIHMLIQIDNISLIHRYKIRHLRQNTWFVRTVKQQFGRFHTPKHFINISELQYSRIRFAKLTIYCKSTNFPSTKFQSQYK